MACLSGEKDWRYATMKPRYLISTLPMPALTLEPENYQSVSDSLTEESWIVACLCAEWCGTCRGYRAGFDEMAERHPDKHFIWIDIEDQAEVVGDLDVDNFPTMLVQYGDIVTYFATVLPDHRQLERLLVSLAGQSAEELKRQATSSEERAEWQEECNLRALLQDAIS